MDMRFVQLTPATPEKHETPYLFRGRGFLTN
ncbi:hypothetical protein BDB13_2398 [Rhodococcus sp. OK302]|nr:hypothetical protein BDB13_2398 [Rhodococcus sp. OK302]